MKTKMDLGWQSDQDLSMKNDLALHENITDYANKMNLEEEKHSDNNLRSEGSLFVMLLL